VEFSTFKQTYFSGGLQKEIAFGFGIMLFFIKKFLGKLYVIQAY